MRLLKIKLKDFRRFGGEHSLDLNENLIALVGPNEVGKSSILDALVLIGQLEFPQVSDTTRNREGPATVSALFQLETEDRALLSEIHEGSSVTHLWVDLVAGRDRPIWRPEPRPRRELSPRRECSGLVGRLEGDTELDAQYSDAPEWAWDPQLYVDVKAILASDDDSLTPEATQSLESLAERIRHLHPPEQVERAESEDDEEQPDEEARAAAIEERRSARRETASALDELVDVERAPSPTRQAWDALRRRTPDIAVFGGDDRELRREYRIDEIADDPPAALQNLCALAELNLGEVRSDLAEGRIPHVESAYESANHRLKERFQATWTQSKVYPRLGTPLDGVMRVMIATESGDYSFPEERSDGLRWFMALHAFLAARGKHDPILLVDEAETHLHYDAQADLIDALMSQPIAKQVIYTTHSVGCLPPDLGCGIRAILADPGAERSRIANSYWSVEPEDDDKIGYTPLLFAMGATLLSLTIPRYGVISEGPSDAVLLPSLFREASDSESLGYRVVPGLAELADERVDSILDHAGRVVCLTDGDEAGDQIRAKLEAGGVPAELIISLGAIVAGCTLEDLLAAEIFARAVNAELDTWGIVPLRIDPQQVPATGRWGWLRSLASETSTPVERLSKTRVAQRAVDLRRSQQTGGLARLLGVGHVAGLRELHERIMGTLGIGS